MAGPNQGDMLGELCLAMLDVYRASGLVRQRIGWDGDGLGKLARLSGQTEQQVQDQLDGLAEPLPGQALALVRALRQCAVSPVGVTSNGKAG
jgi:hypothetical protein